MPANRFQLIPQSGLELAIICSALRYAAGAIDGIPSAPVEFTTMAGGGAETVAAAMCKLAGGRPTATTAGRDGSLAAAAIAVTGVMAALGKAGVGGVNRGAAAPTAPANTSEAIAATADTGVRSQPTKAVYNLPGSAELTRNFRLQASARPQI